MQKKITKEQAELNKVQGYIDKKSFLKLTAFCFIVSAFLTYLVITFTGITSSPSLEEILDSTSMFGLVAGYMGLYIILREPNVDKYLMRVIFPWVVAYRLSGAAALAIGTMFAWTITHTSEITFQEFLQKAHVSVSIALAALSATVSGLFSKYHKEGVVFYSVVDDGNKDSEIETLVSQFNTSLWFSVISVLIIGLPISIAIMFGYEFNRTSSIALIASLLAVALSIYWSVPDTLLKDYKPSALYISPAISLCQVFSTVGCFVYFVIGEDIWYGLGAVAFVSYIANGRLLKNKYMSL